MIPRAGTGLRALAVLAGMVLLAGVFAPGVAAETVLRRGNGAEPETLDVHTSQGVGASNIQRDLFEGLVTEAMDATLIPGAAERWEISDDGTVYTFHLRKDGRWSNGDPVTAQDFVYAMRRLVNPATAAPYAFIAYPILNAKAIASGAETDLSKMGVEAVDDLTLRITLERPTPYFLGMLTHSSMYPVHRKSVEALGTKWIKPGNMISNGAYKLTEWAPQSHITLVKNPYFHDAENVRIDKVIYYPTEDTAAEMKQYRAGELDFTYVISLTDYRWVMKNLKAEASITPYLGAYYYDINLENDKFKDPRVRKALNMAIDREVIANKITRQGQIPAYSFVPPATAHHRPVTPEWAKWTQAQRTKKARELMAEAGYSREQPLKVEILYNTMEDHKRIAIAIASMWKRIGVVTSMRNEEWKALINSRNLKQFEVARDGWIGDYNDPYTFLEILRSDAGPMNNPGYANPEFDALLDAANRELDPERRADLLAKAEAVMLEDLPIIPIYFYVDRHMVKPYLKGFQGNIMGRYLTRWMWIDKTGPGQNIAR